MNHTIALKRAIQKAGLKAGVASVIIHAMLEAIAPKPVPKLSRSTIVKIEKMLASGQAAVVTNKKVYSAKGYLAKHLHGKNLQALNKRKAERVQQDYDLSPNA